MDTSRHVGLTSAKTEVEPRFNQGLTRLIARFDSVGAIQDFKPEIGLENRLKYGL